MKNHKHVLRGDLRYTIVFYILYCKIISEAKYWKKNLSIDQAYELYSKLIKEYTGFDMPASTDTSLFSSLNSSIFVRLQNKFNQCGHSRLLTAIYIVITSQFGKTIASFYLYTVLFIADRKLVNNIILFLNTTKGS